VGAHRAERPKAVVIVAAFLFAATLIATFVGFSLLVPNPLMDRMWTLNPAAESTFRAWDGWAGVFLIALGIATLAAAIGLLKRKKWAWWFAIALFAINGAGDVFGFFVTRDLLRSGSGVIVGCTFLWALGRSRVREYFSP